MCVCAWANEQSPTKCVTSAFTPSSIQSQQLLTWVTSHPLSVNKSTYTYSLQQNGVPPPPPPSTSWPVRVLPLHTSDMWAQSQLENCRQESASSLRWLLRCTHGQQWHPCSYFCLSPARSSVAEQTWRACTCLRSSGRESRESQIPFAVFWNWLTCSPWHQYYLPAPGLVLPPNVPWGTGSRKSNC